MSESTQYTATREFSFAGVQFKKGQVVPESKVTSLMIKRGIVKKSTVDECGEEGCPLPELVDEQVPEKDLSELLIEQPETELDVEIVEDVEISEPDFEWMKSLKSTRANKSKLDEYATQYGIELDASQKISNMIDEFIEKYHAE